MAREPGCMGYIAGAITAACIMATIAIGLFSLGVAFNKLWIGVIIVASIALGSIILGAIDSYIGHRDDYKLKIQQEHYSKVQQFEEYKRDTEKKLAAAMDLAIEREQQILTVLKSSNPFKMSSEMYADIETLVFDKTEIYLRTKPHPAKSSAETVKAMKKIAREYASRYREMEYKFYILLDVFPELQSYIDDSSGDALSMLKDSTLDDVIANYDKVKDYISDEEYRGLSTTERNQLALDRYNARPKSNWTIGVEYEMYIEYCFQKTGIYKTVPHGSLKGINDLGRDIIAETDVNGERYIYIVQCKRYAAGKQIHENTICQLYGTAIEYELSNTSLFRKVVPILYSTVECSPMAKKFADKLGVATRVVPMGTYPQIKCNISSTGEKIYHLPFDQQYYNTLIDKPGEFMAITVEEAERAGFRRARKHIY